MTGSFSYCRARVYDLFPGIAFISFYSLWSRSGMDVGSLLLNPRNSLDRNGNRKMKETTAVRTNPGVKMKEKNLWTVDARSTV